MNRSVVARITLVCGWVCAAGYAAAADSSAPAAGTLEADVRKASAAYVEAYNTRDYAALAAQWATQAELVEGNTRIVGREAIVASIRGWLERHPQAKLAITVTGVEQVAGPLARVTGIFPRPARRATRFPWTASWATPW